MKRMLCALAALALMILTLGTAAAGAGDRTILMLGGADFFASGSLQNLIPAGGKYYLFISSVSDQLMVYDPDTGNAETWDLQDLEDRMLGFTPEAIQRYLSLVLLQRCRKTLPAGSDGTTGSMPWWSAPGRRKTAARWKAPSSGG